MELPVTSTPPNPEDAPPSERPAAGNEPEPKVGQPFRRRIVKALGTLPYSGRPFLLYRFTGRDQLAAQRGAKAVAGADGPTQFELGMHLVANCLLVDAGGGHWEHVKYDDVLDMDGEDLQVVNDCFDGAPSPPPPNS